MLVRGGVVGRTFLDLLANIIDLSFFFFDLCVVCFSCGLWLCLVACGLFWLGGKIGFEDVYLSIPFLLRLYDLVE